MKREERGNEMLQHLPKSFQIFLELEREAEKEKAAKKASEQQKRKGSR